jgi:hypothetical protein
MREAILQFFYYCGIQVQTFRPAISSSKILKFIGFKLQRTLVTSQYLLPVTSKSLMRVQNFQQPLRWLP